jgi:hydrogenase maturation protease
VSRKVLVFGIGNPGRRDDGLGPALAAALEAKQLEGVTIDADYQLTVEDSVSVAEHDVVVFADADAVGPEPYSLKPIGPASGDVGFSTHGAEPGGVLALARQIFEKESEAYVLGIRGYEFELSVEMTERAKSNLEEALKFIEPLLRGQGSFAEAAARLGARG